MGGRFATSPDGVPIAYDDAGAGSPALVFVHGWSCDRSYWRYQRPVFEASHRVVAIDLAGHGDSGVGRSSWTMPAFGADVAAVVDRLGLEDAVLVGHSMGGDVIVEAALILGTRVAGLVWVDVYEALDTADDERGLEAFLGPFRDDFVTRTRAFVREELFDATSDPALAEWVASDMASAPPGIALDAIRHLDEQRGRRDARARPPRRAGVRDQRRGTRRPGLLPPPRNGADRHARKRPLPDARGAGAVQRGPRRGHRADRGGPHDLTGPARKMANGEVAERSIATVLKTVDRKVRGFESHPLRHDRSTMTTEHDHDEHDHDHDAHEHEHHHHEGPHDYGDAIAGYRAEKDAFFKSGAGQPDPGRRARRVQRPAVLPGRRGPRLRGPDPRAVHRRRAVARSRSRRRTGGSGRPIGRASSGSSSAARRAS